MDDMPCIVCQPWWMICHVAYANRIRRCVMYHMPTMMDDISYSVCQPWWTICHVSYANRDGRCVIYRMPTVMDDMSYIVCQPWWTMCHISYANHDGRYVHISYANRDERYGHDMYVNIQTGQISCYGCYIGYFAGRQFTRSFSGVHIARSVVFCVVFCRSLFVHLSFIF